MSDRLLGPRTGRDITAVVLAGGFGTRVRHLLPGVPKPMALVAGRPFLEHVVRFLGAQGFPRVVLSTGYLSEVIEAHFADNRVTGVEVSWVRETNPLGTAGGFMQAARSQAARPTAWLVINGDSLTVTDLSSFVAAFEKGGWDAALLGLRVPDAARFGTLEIKPSGELKQFMEKRPGAGLINAGVYLIPHRLLAQFPVRTPLSFEIDVFPHLAEKGARILVHAVDAPFLDIGTPEALAQSPDFIRRALNNAN